jgi:hypothetical protein
MEKNKVSGQIGSLAIEERGEWEKGRTVDDGEKGQMRKGEEMGNWSKGR